MQWMSKTKKDGGPSPASCTILQMFSPVHWYNFSLHWFFPFSLYEHLVIRICSLGFLYFVFPNKIQYFCSFLGRNPFRNQKRITKQKCSAFFHLETIKIAIYPLDLWTCCRNLIFWPVPPYLPEELEEVWASLLRLQAEWLSDRKG